MEAMPRLPMLSFLLKLSHKPTSFSSFIKRSIATQYGDDPAHFATEVYELDGLRASAVRPGDYMQSLALLKRYSCQLQALVRRFPQLAEQHVDDLVFHWLDPYSGSSSGAQGPVYEMAAIMYNIGALHTILGAADSRQTPDGMKMSCTHFQCAAGAFQYVQERLSQPIGTDLNRGMMQFRTEVALAQAQQCILEKSMVDNRKGIITAKVAAQVADYHRAARRSLENALKTGEYPSENVGDRTMKQWVEHVELKAPLFDAVSLLYRGMQAEELQRMGERIAFYQAASDKLAEAVAVAKRIGGPEGKAVSECLAFISDVIGGKLNNAKKENEFIYHEKVPTIESLPDIKGASLVKGIQFDLGDKDVAGADIFQKLIPMEAHEHASLYSAKKDELLRGLMARVEEKDQELMVLLSSMHLQQLEMMKPYLSGSTSNIQLPQELVDCVASMHAQPTAVPQLHEAMSQLSGLAVDLQDSLDELETMLKEEEDRDKEHTAVIGGRRPPSMILTELRREFAKYRDAHKHAAESDTALHRAISAHLPNLSLLAGPLEALVSQLPSVQALVQQPESTAAVQALQRMVDKVDEMRRQRSMLCGHIRDAVHSDDITKRVVTGAGDDIEAFMDRELDKHRKQAAVIEQNLAAQDNILRALTEANAAYAPTRQQASDLLAAREARVSELLGSHRALDELLSKGKQGVNFYNKLQESVAKLLTRARGVCKVHAEERTSSLTPSGGGGSAAPAASSGAGGPRLRDYLAAGYRAGDQPPRVRPSPLGSEQTDPACSSTGGYAAQMAQYMQPGRQEAASAPEAGGYAAQMAQYMQKGGAAEGRQDIASAPEPGGYASQMAQYMQKGGGGSESGGYAAQMAQYMKGGAPAAARPAAPGGQPGAAVAGYGAAQPAAGYPPQQAPGGYPSQQRQAGYPAQPGQSRYPAQPPHSGYPAQPNQCGYPAQPPHSGYPTQPGQAGYPPQQQAYSAYTSQQSQSNPAQQSSQPAPAPQRPPADSSGGGYPQTGQPGYPAPAASAAPAQPGAAVRGAASAGPPAPAGPLAASSAAVSGQYGYQSSDPYLAFYGGGGYTSWTPYQTFSRPAGEPAGSAPFSSSHRPLAAASPHGPAAHSHGASSATPTAPETPPAVYTPPRLVGTGPAQTNSRPSGIAPYALATGYPSSMASPTSSAAQVPASMAGGPAAGPVVNGSAPGYGATPVSSGPYQSASYSGSQLQAGYGVPQPGSYPPASQTQSQAPQTQPQAPYPATGSGPRQYGAAPAVQSGQYSASPGLTSGTEPGYSPGQQQQAGYPPAPAAAGQMAPPAAGAGQQTQFSPSHGGRAGYGGTAGTPAGQYPPQGYPGQQAAAGAPAAYQQPGASQYYSGYGPQYPAGSQAGQQPAQTPAQPQQRPASSQQQYQNQQQPQSQRQHQQQQQQYQNQQQQAQRPQSHQQQQQYPNQPQQQQYSNQQQQPQQIQYPNQQHQPNPAQQQPQRLRTGQLQPSQYPTQQQPQYPTQQQHQQQYRTQQPHYPTQQQHQQPQYPTQQQQFRGVASVPQFPSAGPGGQVPRPVASAPAVLNTAQAPGQPAQHVPPDQASQYRQPSAVARGAAQHGQQPPAGLNTAQYDQSGSPLNTAQYVQHAAAAVNAAQGGPQQPAGPAQMAPPMQPNPPPALEPPLQPERVQPPPGAAHAKAGDLLSQSARLLAGLDLSAPAASPSPPAPQQPPPSSQPVQPSPQPVQPASAPISSTQLADGSPMHQRSDGDLLTAAAAAAAAPAPAPAPAAVLQPRVVTSETERLNREQAERERRKLAAAADPYADPEKLAAFVQEVERMDKFVAGMTKKSLNGPTPLDSKWKELMDQQEVDSRRLQISVARCYPMKNRLQDVLPFDQSLVPVPMVRDDYINASRLPELASGAPALIVTQAPLPVTQTDFWCMVWHHQVELIICLLPDNEMEGQIYWPTERGVAVPYGPVQLTLQSQSPTNGRVERIFSLLHTETKMSRVVIHLQFIEWPRAALPSSPAPLVQFAVEVLNYHQQQRSLLRPLAVHCAAGAGRSGVFCLLAAALAELRAGGGLLDPAAAAALLHQARRHCLQDKHHLLFAYQAVLYAAQDFLMKRGILTSRATFDDPPGGGPSRGHSRHPSEDFLAATRSVGELQARLGTLSGSSAAATAAPPPPVPSSPSRGSVSLVSLPAAVAPPVVATPPSTSSAATAEAPSGAASRGSSAPLLCGPLAACLDPATFELGGPAEPEPKPDPTPPAAGHDPLSDLDPLWSLKK